MNIQVNPYKLSLSEMEVRLDGKTPLLPGQLLRFDAESPVYGEVVGVRTLDPEKQEGSLAKIRVLYGVPNLSMRSATLLSDDQMTAEVQRLQEPFEYPLQLGGFTAEFDSLGALTLIEGDEFSLKYEALNTFIQAIRQYQRLVIIDPLGVYTANGQAYYRAGEDIRLSLQSVGSKRFLTAMAETFPESLRNQALQVLAGYLPVTAEFVGFQEILHAVSYDHSPMRNLLLQSLQAASHGRVFADAPEHEFDFQRLVTDAVTAIDLSSMDEPWKTLFYEEICLEIFRNAGGDVVPVLIYPENYLSDFETWVHKADEAELNLLVLTSPYPPDALDRMANNLVLADAADAVRMEGELTLGLPVTFALPALPEAVPETQPLAQPEEPSLWVEVPPQPALAAEPEAAVTEPETWPQAVAEEPAPCETPAEPAGMLPEAPPVMAPDFPIPGPPEDEAPLEPVVGPASQYDSILGNVEAVKAVAAEPDDFDFDLNLDLQDHGTEELVLQTGMPDSMRQAMQEFSQPPPSEAPPVSPAPESQPTRPEAAWGPSISDIEAGLTQPAYSEASPPPPVVGPEAYEPPTSGLYIQPEEQPLMDASAGPLYETDVFEPELPALEPEPPQLAALEAFPAEEFGPPVEIPAGIVDITAPQAPPLEYTVTEPDPYEMMPVYSKPEQPEGGYRGFSVGDRVVHPDYGSGVISKVIPMEDYVILNITFDKVGKRLLDPALCQLERE